MYGCICIYIYIYIHPSICPSIHYLSTYLSVHPSIARSAYLFGGDVSTFGSKADCGSLQPGTSGAAGQCAGPRRDPKGSKSPNMVVSVEWASLKRSHRAP